MKHLTREPPAPQFPSFTIAKNQTQMKRIILLVCFMACCGCAGAQGWFELGTGANALNANNPINTLCSDTAGNIYAAGEFSDSNWAFSKHYVAKWDCMSHIWSELGGTGSNALNANETINSICVDKFGNVYAAGDFTDSTHISFPEGYEYVAKWSPVTGIWEKLGIGAHALNAHGVINSICVDDSGHIYAAGNFRNSIGQSYVAKWNGTNWTELYGLNANQFIYSICVDDSFNVYASGGFSDGSGHVYVAKYNPTTAEWSELGSGFYFGSYEIEITASFTDTSNHVCVAVNFGNDTIVSNIFKWNGVNWNQLGVLDANLYTTSICKGDSGFVYATGLFTNSSDETYVAKYDPQHNTWSELGGSNSLAPHNEGYGNKAPVKAICEDIHHNLYAAGDFSDSISVTNDYCYVAEYGINTLAVQSVTADYGVKVYPNPTTKEIKVVFNQAGNNVNQYSLLDGMGRIRKTGPIYENTDTAIDVSQLTNGIYELVIGQTIFKIIKK